VMVEVNLKDDFVEESAEEKEQLAKSKLLVWKNCLHKNSTYILEW
jgi:hypothetical protein